MSIAFYSFKNTFLNLKFQPMEEKIMSNQYSCRVVLSEFISNHVFLQFPKQLLHISFINLFLYSYFDIDCVF